MKILYPVSVFALIISSIMAQAQPDRTGKWFFRGGIGYGIAHAGQTTILNGLLLAGTRDIGSVAGPISVKRGSLGAGGLANLSGGRMLTSHVGIELGIQATVLPVTYHFSTYYAGSSLLVEEYTTRANPLIALVPALVLSSGGAGPRAYARTGLILPITDEVSMRRVRPTASNTETVYEYSLRHRFSVGFHGAAGFSYPVSKRLRIWAEIGGNFRNAYTRKLETTRYTVSGADRLGTLSTSERLQEHEFEVDGTFQGQDSPRKVITSASPFSNIGLNAGVWIAL